MTGKTKIEWTDKTWNPIVGCSIVSPGCTNCYAMKFAGNRLDGNPKAPHYAGTTTRTKAGPVWTGKVALAPDHILTAPLRWRKPAMIFVNSMGDLFHEDVPDAWIDRVFAVMALTPQHTYQVLTKRAERMKAYMERRCPNGHRPSLDYAAIMAATGRWNTPKLDLTAWPLPNVWLGVSTEDQARADERIPNLLETPAAVRFISAEPLLGPIDLNVAWHGEDALDAECWGECAWCDKGFPPLHNCQKGIGDWERGKSGLDWIIAGGESGPGARPMHPDWVRSLRDQCADAGVAFFFKQWGEWEPHTPKADGDLGGDVRRGTVQIVQPGGEDLVEVAELTGGRSTLPGARYMRRVGKKAAGHMLDGIAHRAFPEVAT